MAQAKNQVPPGHYWNKKYLRYFSYSLKRFPDKYIPLIFDGQPKNDDYLVYLCPICLINSLVVEKSTIFTSAEFSEDHFPPQSVGGRSTVLVCKDCNNTAGNSYENSLIKKLAQVSFDKRIPGSLVKAKVVIDTVKGWRHGIVGVSDDNSTYFQLNVTKNETLPALTPEQQTTNNGGKGWKATISTFPSEHDLVKRALLKTAYLYCFFNWGYDFAFSDKGTLIRQAFLGQNAYPIEVGKFWFDDQSPIRPPYSIPKGLCFIVQPIQARSLVVNIPMRLKTNGYACVVPVLIPSPSPSGIDDLKTVQNLLESNPGMTININIVNNALLHTIVDCYQRTWDDLIKELEIT